MTADHQTELQEFEARLWKVADSLRANANLPSNEYFMPVMGLLFLGRPPTATTQRLRQSKPTRRPGGWRSALQPRPISREGER